MSWNIQTPGDYINGPLTVAGAALFNSSIGIGEAATNGIKLLTSVANGGFPATTGTLQSSGSIRVTASDTTGCLDIGTAGAVSWIQACRRTNLADNFALVLNPNGGNIGIGTNSPNSNANRSTLTLQGAWGGQIDINVGALNHAQFGTDNFSSGASCRIQSQDSIVFKTSGATIGAFLNTNGAFSLQNAVSNANGTGIVFPSAQNASTDANTLDDYEEGAWTATLKGSVSDPTTPVTATGRYTKVGRQVTVQVYIANVVTTGASGRIGISGLPFANNGSTETVGAVGLYDIATFTGSPFAQVGFNATQVDLYSSVSNSTWQAVTHNAGNARYLWFNMTYTV